MRTWRIVCGMVLACACLAQADIRVIDDAGLEVVLSHPAQRIVSIAPHTTELLFEAGAGAKVVATTRFSDHPEAARKIERIGDNAMLDVERIVDLHPDLVVAWLHGNSQAQLDRIRLTGLPVFQSEPRRLEDIPGELSRLGELAGTQVAAAQAAAEYAARLQGLKTTYSGKPVVPVFFQVWQRPLLTINGAQVMSRAIELCGGRNVFADLRVAVPTVDVEGVIARNPEVVLATAGADAQAEEVFSAWLELPRFEPALHRNLILLRTDALGRPSARMLEGVEKMCQALEQVRRRRTS